MGETVQFFVEQGSYGLMLLALLVAGLGAPFPEDIVLVSGGILVQRGITTLPATVAVCVFGVLVGDLTIFMIARKLGPSIYRRKFIAKVLPPHRRHRLELLFSKYGGFVVFCARHLAGLRAPTFAVAAIHGMSVWKFLFFDMLGLAVSLPVVMYLGYIFADNIEHALTHLQRVEHLILFAVAVLLVGFGLYQLIRFFKKKEDALLDGPAPLPEALEKESEAPSPSSSRHDKPE